MPKTLKSPDEYRERAAQLRTKAATYSAERRAALLEIAAHYDMIADSVVAIERSNKKLNPLKP